MCHPLMRSSPIEVGDIAIEHALELFLLNNQQMIQACLSDAPGEALADRIGAWSVRRRFENLDTTSPCHPSKAGPKFAVVITNQVLWCLPIRGGFSQLLGYPGIGRRACNAHMDPPCVTCVQRRRTQRAVERTGQSPARSRRPRSVPRECARSVLHF